MKFIIPKNYKYQMKFLGFINYTTVLVDAIIAVVFFYVISLFTKNIEMKIYIFVSLYFPIILFSIFGVGNENIVDVAIYMFKFLRKQKVYLYNK